MEALPSATKGDDAVDETRDCHRRTLSTRTALALCAAASVGVTAGCSGPAAPAPQTSLTAEASTSTAEEVWPPTEGTDGAWLPLPASHLAPGGEVEACGTTLTADYAPGAAMEYQAEVSGTTTTVRYRVTSATTDVVRADGTTITLDNTGPSTDVYEDVNGDGSFDVYRSEATGPSLLVPGLPEQSDAAAAAGLPAFAYWTDGSVEVVFTFPTDPDAMEPPAIAVTSSTTSAQDVCQLLDQAAGAATAA